MMHLGTSMSGSARRMRRTVCQPSLHFVPSVLVFEIFVRGAPLTMKIWLAWSSALVAMCA